MAKRVTMKHLVKRQELVTKVVPDFRLEFRYNLVRALKAGRILSDWMRNREMNAWIEGLYRGLDLFKIGEK